MDRVLRAFVVSSVVAAALLSCWVPAHAAEAKFDPSISPAYTEPVVLASKDGVLEVRLTVKQGEARLNTVAVPHNLDAYVSLLKRNGTMVLVGAPSSPHPSPAVFNLIFKRRAIAGSLIGGIPETQEMLDFCAKHNIVSEVEVIKMQEIEKAYERMLKSDVKYRFSIDMASLKT